MYTTNLTSWLNQTNKLLKNNNVNNLNINYNNSNIYKCEEIFNDLVEFTINNNLYLNIPEIDIDKTYLNKNYIFDKKMKKKLYEFIKFYSI